MFILVCLNWLFSLVNLFLWVVMYVVNIVIMLCVW